MTIPIRNVYYLLCYAWDHLPEQDAVDVGALEGMDRVQDLLGKVLAEGTFRLVRRGIDRGYREVTEELAGVRGKLEIGAMATRATRVRSRTVCTFEEFSADVLHNRILRSALDVLARTPELDRDIRRDVIQAREALDGVSIVPLRPLLFRRIQLDRNQRTYHFLLSVCELVMRSTLVDPGDGQVRFRDFRRDEATMWKLFEDFVAAFYRREQDEYHVAKQTRIDWSGTGADEGASPHPLLPRMTPDLVLESPTRRIVLDTKFYSNPLGGSQYADKLHAGNLYQLLAYLVNRQATRPEGPRHEGMLLYAAVGEDLRFDGQLQGFRVQARTVDLSREWWEVEEELLEAVGRGPDDPMIWIAFRDGVTATPIDDGLWQVTGHESLAAAFRTQLNALFGYAWLREQVEYFPDPLGQRVAAAASALGGTVHDEREEREPHRGPIVY